MQNTRTKGNSYITVDPTPLKKHLGTGEKIWDNIPFGKAGYKEKIEFPYKIGYGVNQDTKVETTTRWGIVTYSQNGYHIFPVKGPVPQQWWKNE